MSFVFFCRIGTCRPCARGVCGAGLRLLNVRRAKILFSAVIFFLPAAIFRPPAAFPPAPNPLFPVSFAPFDPPSAFLSPFLSSRLFRPPPSSLPFFPFRFVPRRCFSLFRPALPRDPPPSAFLSLSRPPCSLPPPFPSLRTDSEIGSVSCISGYYSLSCRSFILNRRHGLFPVG